MKMLKLYLKVKILKIQEYVRIFSIFIYFFSNKIVIINNQDKNINYFTGPIKLIFKNFKFKKTLILS